MANTKTTQEYVEVLSSGPGASEVTQEYVEALSSAEDPHSRVTQEYVEVLSDNTSPDVRVTQEYVEVLSSYTNVGPSTMAGRKLSLGCGTYTVLLTERGGVNPIAYLPFNQLSWQRSVDDISNASLSIPTSALSDTAVQKCCAALFGNGSFDGEADSWSHEISILRDQEQVWVGPITHMSGNFEGIQIQARDLMAWFGKRWLPRDRNIVSDLSGLFKTFAEDALNQEPSPNIELVAYAVNAINRRVARAVDHIKALNMLNEIAKDGVDYTVQNRRLIFGDLDALATDLDIQLALPQYAITNGNWEKRGQDTATQFALLGQPPGGSAAPLYAEVGGEDAKYGLLQESQAEPILTVEAFLLYGATARLEMIKTPPKYIDVTLSPKAPFTINQIYPGFLIDVNLMIGCLPLNQQMRLHEFSVSVTIDDDGAQKEEPTMTIVPKGMPDVGFGFDVGFSDA